MPMLNSHGQVVRSDVWTKWMVLAIFILAKEGSRGFPCLNVIARKSFVHYRPQGVFMVILLMRE